MDKTEADVPRPVKRYIVRFFHQDMGGCECPFEPEEHEEARERRDEINAGLYARMSDARIVRVYAKGK